MDKKRYFFLLALWATTLFANPYQEYLAGGESFYQGCKTQSKPLYASQSDEREVLTSFYASVHYYTLTLIADYLNAYEQGKKVKTPWYREAMNSCSPEITYAARSTLEKIMKRKNSPLRYARKVFPLSKEQFHKMKSFWQELCSWGPQSTELPPVATALLSDLYYYNAMAKEFTRPDNLSGLRIRCQRELCRPERGFFSIRKLPLRVGGQNLKSDLFGHYCARHHGSPSSFLEEVRLLGYMHTGVAPQNRGMRNLVAAKELLLKDQQEYWDTFFAQRERELISKLFFEEGLELRVNQAMEKEWFFVFDIGYGEFDREYQGVDKLSFEFYLKMKKSFLVLLWQRLRQADDYVQRVALNLLRQEVAGQMVEKEQVFNVVPWNKSFIEDFVQQIARQIRRSPEEKILQYPLETFALTLQFRYGVGALREIHALAKEQRQYRSRRL